MCVHPLFSPAGVNRVRGVLRPSEIRRLYAYFYHVDRNIYCFKIKADNKKVCIGARFAKTNIQRTKSGIEQAGPKYGGCSAIIKGR